MNTMKTIAWSVSIVIKTVYKNLAFKRYNIQYRRYFANKYNFFKQKNFRFLSWLMGDNSYQPLDSSDIRN